MVNNHWLYFKELFDAIVDKNEHLSFVQKLQKCSLVGDAAKLFQQLQVLGTNYAPMKAETAQGLRGLLDGEPRLARMATLPLAFWD